MRNAERMRPSRIKVGWVLLGLATLILSEPHPSFPQSPEELRAIQRDLETLKEGQTAIHKELQEIKNRLGARPAPRTAAPQDVVLNIKDAPFKGNEHAKLTLVDFSDFQ